ncbi:uncharacterized protein DFL_006621 [Arthrobotrys flagrans]|uniref:Uncharacterized protein n=1 Tax=Arthrobotrys flagrans TaxID=97331 RepID=A0A436ZTF5_ARTFL|nr:hypothetical protein DFL_006621 [Arthrobotrys flagrans]
MVCEIDCAVLCCYPFKMLEVVEAASIFMTYFLIAISFLVVMSGIFASMFHIISFCRYVNGMINEIGELSNRVCRLEDIEARVAQLRQSQLSAADILNRLVVRKREREIYGYGAIRNENRSWHAGSEYEEESDDEDDDDYIYEQSEYDIEEYEEYEEDGESGKGDESDEGSDKENRGSHVC